jgi:tetratricopeptide (TPR) repeat protein
VEAVPLALRPWLLAAVALVALAVAWGPGLSAPYQYDDYITPLKDPASQSLAAWAKALPNTLRPLTKLSYALESDLGASEAPARRVLNVGLFGLALFLLTRLLRASGLSYALALALATLWAVHPVHAELLIALAGRSVLLSLVLTLASAAWLAEGRTKSALALALLALLARETALPWLVVCAGVIALEQGRTRARLGLALLGALGLGGLVVLASSRMRTLLAFSFADASAFDRLGQQWAALPKGVVMLLVEPGAFTVDIDFAPLGAERAAYVLLTLAMYGAALWVALGRGPGTGSRPLRIAALLWLCLVVPLHSLVPKLDPLTARGVSVSAAGLCVLLAAGAARALTGHARFVIGITTLLAILLVPLTRQRAALYRDPVELWRDAAAHSRKSSRPLMNLGTLLAQRGQLVEARAALEAAVRKNPGSSEAREKLAAVAALLETQRLLKESRSHEAVQEHDIKRP